MTTPHLLTGCRAKIARANELLTYLDGEFKAILVRKAHTVTGAHDTQKSRYVFRLRGPPIDPRLAVIVGEIVHHLRSSLDHLVCALILHAGNEPKTNNQFPIADTKERYNELLTGGMLHGVPRPARLAIGAMQPYTSANPAMTIFRIVHNLDISEKHALLPVVVGAHKMGNTIKFSGPLSDNLSVIVDPKTFFHHAIENDEEVYWLKYEGGTVTGGDPQWYVENDLRIVIAFDKVGKQDRPEVIPLLTQLCAGVAGSILKFEKFFV